MPIKAIIWDIGGVIIRTEDRTPRDQLAAELGVTRERLNELFFSGPEGTRAQKGEITIPELMAHIRSELDLAPDEHPDMQERFFAGDQLDHDLVAYIRSLKPRYKIGIISNAWGQLSQLLEDWEIQDTFDVVIGSGDVGVMKPDPKIFHLALSGLDIKPDEAIFVDDFIDNVRGARELGINAIQFRDTDQAVGEVKALIEEN